MNATDIADMINAITVIIVAVIVCLTILITANWWWKRSKVNKTNGD